MLRAHKMTKSVHGCSAHSQAQIMASQPPERQAHLTVCLDKLMTDVNRNLEPKNRDKFTQNVTLVRHEYRMKS